MMSYDEEIHNPLLDKTSKEVEDSRGASTKNGAPSRACSLFRRCAVVAILGVAAVAATAYGFTTYVWDRNHSLLGHKVHGHVSYQATLKPNNQIDYTREFTAPCDYGILVFNVGPAASYMPFKYDVYQDAYVFSNNDKLCWFYPTYRGIQKGPFPWWVQGDPTNFDVPTGLTMTKISHRIVRPAGSQNFDATKGGDYLIMAHHNFFTPAFYENLKDEINSWTDDDSDDITNIDLEALFHRSSMEKEEETLPISEDFEIVP